MCKVLKTRFAIKSFGDQDASNKAKKIIRSTKQGNLNVWKVQGLGKQRKRHANECATTYNPMMS
jgi:hypothetical protein